MPRVLSPDGFKDYVERLTRMMTEAEEISRDEVVFVVGDLYSASSYSASDNDPRDRLHARLSYGEEGAALPMDGATTGLNGLAMDGLRGALLGTGMVTLDELGPEATGVALENLGRVPESEPEEVDHPNAETHIQDAGASPPMEAEDGEVMFDE